MEVDRDTASTLACVKISRAGIRPNITFLINVYPCKMVCNGASNPASITWEQRGGQPEGGLRLVRWTRRRVDTSGVRPGVRPDVRPDVRAARVSSAAPKKKSFDRGGPVWPPRSNVTNDRLRGGSGGALPPQPKTGGSGGQRPPAKTENFRKNAKIYVYTFICLFKVLKFITALPRTQENFRNCSLFSKHGLSSDLAAR